MKQTDRAKAHSRSTNTRPAEASGTFLIGGDIPVRRLGFGAMQLTGDGVWGEPPDHSEAIAVLRRAVELGIRRITPIVSVQNRYNLVDRNSEDALEYCTRENLGFIPWFPLATGKLAKHEGPLTRAAKRLNAQPAQIALAWLLRKSPVTLPIPGTSKVKHLEENTAAALIELDDSTMQDLERLGKS